MSNKNYYGNTSKERISTGTEDMQELNVRAMEIANRRNDFTPDWSIISVRRSAEEQNEIWQIGRSQSGKVTGDVRTYNDGYINKSIHQTGDATDFVPWVDGKAVWDNKEYFAIIASCYYEAAMELKLKIRWGGHFTKFYDGGHIEIVR
jgi:peptidoglycan LD-endopeptidase CwlK